MCVCVCAWGCQVSPEHVDFELRGAHQCSTLRFEVQDHDFVQFEKRGKMCFAGADRLEIRLINLV